MNVLLDIHHHDLFRSLYLLFNNRLDFNVYLPYGMEWNTEYKYANYPDIQTVTQYLVGVKHWINFGGDLPNIKFITLDEFKDLKMDILVSSLMENVEVFDKLNTKLNKNAKQIIQVGNNFPISLIDHIGKNLMSSSTYVYDRSKISNKIFYHQEFDVNLFRPPESISNLKAIYSFQHYFGTGCPPYKEDYDLFCKMKSLMTEFDFRCYGCGNEYGSIPGIPTEMSKAMREPAFVFHTKPQGDGYGHIYHNSYACGKPVIFKSEYLHGMTPEMLFDDDTSIDLSTLSITEVREKLTYMSDNYNETSKKVYARFKNVVDFDKEFIFIKTFIENLI